MPLSTDSSSSVRMRFVIKIIPTLNNYYGPLNHSLVLDLISTLDSLKFDKDKEVRNSAHDVDEKIHFYKNPTKEQVKECE